MDNRNILRRIGEKAKEDVLRSAPALMRLPSTHSGEAGTEGLYLLPLIRRGVIYHAQVHFPLYLPACNNVRTPFAFYLQGPGMVPNF